MKISLAVIVAVVCCSTGCRDPQTQTPPSPATVAVHPFSRDSALRLIADVRRIGTPEGIDTLFEVTAGDSKQWISVRGLNRANPVLLMIHGGPGSPMMPLSWAYQKPWEDFFTVVQWDQRGAGKNFLGTDTTTAKRPFTVGLIVDDAVAVIGAVQQLLGKKKVVVLGFSWGSMVGVRLVAKRPDLVHAYVGVGQAGTGDDERYLYDRALELAKLHRNDTAIRELSAIAPYPGAHHETPIASTRLVRKWAGTYNGGWYGWPSIDLFYRIPTLAPEYSDADLSVQRVASKYAGGALFAAMVADDGGDLERFQVPMIFMQGRYDLFTPYATARQFYEKLKAPTKKFVTFERSSHFVMLEEPGRFLTTLVREVLPLTGEAATFPIGADAPR